MVEEINSMDRLKSILEKTYWLESYYEHIAEWEAYIANESYRDTLFELINESVSHKSVIEEISGNLGINFTQNIDINEKFNFDKMSEGEVFSRLLKYEKLMLDIYSKLLNHTKKDLITQNWKRENPEEFFNRVKWLVAQEEKHIKMIKPLASDLIRVCPNE